MRRLVWIVPGLVCLLAAATLAGAWWHLRNWARSPKPGAGKALTVEIPKGVSAGRIAEILEQRGIIDDADKFSIWLRWYTGQDRQLKAGELSLRDDRSPDQTLTALLRGTPVLHRITIPEGLRIEQVAALFEAAGLADAARFEARAREPGLAKALGVLGDDLEGFLFPDTYLFARHTPIDRLLATMVARYERVFSPEWRARARRFRRSERNLITLASIIELEARDPADRKPVAAVFYNRLRYDWKLASDASAAHAERLSTGRFDGTVSPEDRERDHPYNTHRRKKLPPGPLCSPGAAAIEAALYPPINDHMYFMDSDEGARHYCPDLRCHQKLKAR